MEDDGLRRFAGYAVSAEVWLSRDSGIQTGGDIYRTGSLENREINVFENPSTVSGKPAVIAPGSKGCYTFTIQNTKDFPMEISWQLSDENEHQIPMQYRLKTGSDYLYGSAQEWIPCDGLDQYLIQDRLAPGEQREYALDWEWPFSVDAAQDEADTKLGDLAASGTEVVYRLSLLIRAEGEQPETGTDPGYPDTNEPSGAEPGAGADSQEHPGADQTFRQPEQAERPEQGLTADQPQGNLPGTGHSGANQSGTAQSGAGRWEENVPGLSRDSDLFEPDPQKQPLIDRKDPPPEQETEDGQKIVEVVSPAGRHKKCCCLWWLLLLLLIIYIIRKLRETNETNETEDGIDENR